MEGKVSIVDVFLRHLKFSSHGPIHGCLNSSYFCCKGNDEYNS